MQSFLKIKPSLCREFICINLALVANFHISNMSFNAIRENELSLKKIQIYSKHHFKYFHWALCIEPRHLYRCYNGMLTIIATYLSYISFSDGSAPTQMLYRNVNATCLFQ